MTFTLSRRALLAACAYPFAEGREWLNEPDADAQWGTEFHQHMATYIETGAEPKGLTLEQACTWMHAKAYVDAQRIPRTSAEGAYVYDPYTEEARYLGRFVHREYEKNGAKPHEICGTVDASVLDGSTAHVYEWTTSGAADLDHKVEQARACAFVIARTYDIEQAVVHVVRFDENGAHPLPPETLDMFKLAAIEEKLKADLARIPDAEPTPGLHCTELRCPHRAFCPVTQEVVSQVLPAESIVPAYRMVPAIESEEHAAWLVERIRILTKQGEAIESALKTYAREHHGIRLSDGKVWDEGFRTMQRLNVKALEALAREKGATDEDVARCVVANRESAGFRAKKTKGERAA